MRGATVNFARTFEPIVISTHAPLAGRDRRDRVPYADEAISTHAPLAGRDTDYFGNRQQLIDFNPRAPCGARRGGKTASCGELIFQPTRPLRGATLALSPMYWFIEFQPTRPLRGATVQMEENVMDAVFQPTRPLRGATGCKPYWLRG